jgi:plasmid stabilization system protein ParE
MKIRWSRAAVEDLREAEAFIAADSPLYAQRFVARLLSSTRRLGTHPRIGRRVLEADDPDIRELIVQSYRIIYPKNRSWRPRWEEGGATAAVIETVLPRRAPA